MTLPSPESDAALSERRPRWQRAALGAALLVIGIVALVAAVGGEGPEVWSALKQTPVWSVILLTALGVPGMFTRTEAWRLSIVAAQQIEGDGAKTVGRPALYLANSVGLLANQLSIFLGLAAQVGTLRRAAPHSPNVSRLIAATVPVSLLEALVAGVLLLWALVWLGLPVWIAVALAAVALGLSVLGARLSGRGRASDVRHWLHGLSLLRLPKSSAAVGALMLVTLLLTVARIQISLGVFGIDVSFAQAVLALLLTGVLGTLGLGPSAIPGGLLIIFNSSSIAAATSAGLLALGTTVLCTLLFAACVAVIVWAQRRSGGSAPLRAQSEPHTPLPPSRP